MSQSDLFEAPTQPLGARLNADGEGWDWPLPLLPCQEGGGRGKVMRTSYRPKKAIPIAHPQTKDGWWYEHKFGIDVMVQPREGNAVGVRIYWRDLLRAAQRSSKGEVIVR